VRLKHIIFSILFFSNAFAQDLYKKYDYKNPIISQSNYLYRNFVASNNDLYYWNKSFLETKETPIFKISPLGTEVIIVNENKISLYNPLIFTNEFTSSLKLKNDKVVKITSDGFGKKYYLATLNGKLFESYITQDRFITTEVPTDFFVSHFLWNNNLSMLSIADDFYLYNVNPVDFSVQAKVKLEREITSITINEKGFEVAVGLSDGKIFIYDQTLSKLKNKIEISKAPITSIQYDPIDHYLFVGDDRGFLYTYDFLKNKVVKSQELHTGAVIINGFFDPVINKKFIITSGNDLFLNVFDISSLEPNFSRVISERTTKYKESFLKFRNNESPIYYEKRTSSDNVNKAIAEERTKVIDSIALTKKNSIEPEFKISDGLLNIEVHPFPIVKMKIPSEIKNTEGLKFENLHYTLNDDNTFSIDKIDVLFPELDYKLSYNSDKKLMSVNDERIALALARKIAKEEETLKNNLSALVSELRSRGELNDVDLKLESYLKKEKDSLGNDELNLHIAFLTQGINASVEKNTADFAPGKYSLFESKAAQTLVSFFIQSASNKLSEYLQPNTRITFKLTGATDKSKIINPLPYNNDYGVFKNFPYYFQSSLAGMNLSKETGIAENNQLGFLRTYSVRKFIENDTDLFELTKNKYIHYVEVSENFGAEFRKIKIELVIHSVDKIKAKSNSIVSDEKPLSDVDINIPQGKLVDGYALVIGNEDYASYQKDLSPENNVPFAVRDSEVFKKYLENLYGFKSDNIDLKNNATFGEMSQAISKLERLMDIDGKDKEIVVYYSGHGMPDESTKEPYLIPVDISGYNVAQGIALKDLMSRLSKKPHKKITIVLDACFSGLAKNESLVKLKGITVTPVNPELGDNMVLITSSSGNESSLADQENQHGLFTYYFLKQMKETNGTVELSKFFENLKKDVGLSAIKKYNKIQTPNILIGKSLREKTEVSLFSNE
jgi:hypothetical protein